MLATQYWCATPNNRYGLALFRQTFTSDPLQVFIQPQGGRAPPVSLGRTSNSPLQKTFRGLPYPCIPPFQLSQQKIPSTRTDIPRDFYLATGNQPDFLFENRTLLTIIWQNRILCSLPFLIIDLGKLLCWDFSLEKPHSPGSKLTKGKKYYYIRKVPKSSTHTQCSLNIYTNIYILQINHIHLYMV